jgi:hypothetical protein
MNNPNEPIPRALKSKRDEIPSNSSKLKNDKKPNISKTKSKSENSMQSANGDYSMLSSRKVQSHIGPANNQKGPNLQIKSATDSSKESKGIRTNFNKKSNKFQQNGKLGDRKLGAREVLDEQLLKRKPKRLQGAQSSQKNVKKKLKKVNRLSLLSQDFEAKSMIVKDTSTPNEFKLHLFNKPKSPQLTTFSSLKQSDNSIKGQSKKKSNKKKLKILTTFLRYFLK